jgi:hypothetical protein
LHRVSSSIKPWSLLLLDGVTGGSASQRNCAGDSQAGIKASNNPESLLVRTGNHACQLRALTEQMEYVCCKTAAQFKHRFLSALLTTRFDPTKSSISAHSGRIQGYFDDNDALQCYGTRSWSSVIHILDSPSPCHGRKCSGCCVSRFCWCRFSII